MADFCSDYIQSSFSDKAPKADGGYVVEMPVPTFSPNASLAGKGDRHDSALRSAPGSDRASPRFPAIGPHNRAEAMFESDPSGPYG